MKHRSTFLVFFVSFSFFPLKCRWKLVGNSYMTLEAPDKTKNVRKLS